MREDQKKLYKMRERKEREERQAGRQKEKFTQYCTVPWAQISHLVSFRKYTHLLSSWSGLEWRGPRDVLADQHPLPLLTELAQEFPEATILLNCV